jgi:hypothetical protein
MKLAVSFRFRGSDERQYRTTSRLKIDAKGNLLLYPEGSRIASEKLRLDSIEDLSIASVAGSTQNRLRGA